LSPPPPPLLKHNPSAPGHGHVRYEIHLHPTYQAPCLWFSLHDLPADEQEQALHVDTVFRRLVPEQYKEGLRGSLGGIGGISVDVRPPFSSFFLRLHDWGWICLFWLLDKGVG
jgi:ubiquitin-like-conjugating enzyme ATG10